MGKYVIEINEKTRKGKAIKTLLEQDADLKILEMEKFEELENKVLSDEIRKAKKTRLLSYEQGKAEFRKLRRRFSK